jgi:PIN domain nuclease of toxin-antitoxin system
LQRHGAVGRPRVRLDEHDGLGVEAVGDVQHLPRLHADPFDRMLIGQVGMGGMTQVTPDPQIQAYPVPTAGELSARRPQ